MQVNLSVYINTLSREVKNFNAKYLAMMKKEFEESDDNDIFLYSDIFETILEDLSNDEAVDLSRPNGLNYYMNRLITHPQYNVTNYVYEPNLRVSCAWIKPDDILSVIGNGGTMIMSFFSTIKEFIDERPSEKDNYIFEYDAELCTVSCYHKKHNDLILLPNSGEKREIPNFCYSDATIIYHYLKDEDEYRFGISYSDDDSGNTVEAITLGGDFAVIMSQTSYSGVIDDNFGYPSLYIIPLEIWRSGNPVFTCIGGGLIGNYD